jgi:Mg2+ and Co2+ transporter CorA
MARELRAAGRMEAAEEHLHQAKALARELRPELLRGEQIRKREVPPREGAPVPRQIIGEIAELRRDINRLRDELAEVRELLKRLIEQERREGRP